MKYSWIHIAPWRAWLVEEWETRYVKAELPKSAFALDLGIHERRLYTWMVCPRTKYAQLHVVENALWTYDCKYLHDVLGEIEILESLPEYQENGRRNKRDQKGRFKNDAS